MTAGGARIRVERVRLIHIELPLVHPFETSFGRTVNRGTILVRVDGGGLTGWGELTAHEAPTFSYETLETARHVLADFFVPRLLAAEYDSPGDFLSAVRFVRGHPMARSALEGALHDWSARSVGLPLASWLGGVRARVAVGVSLGIEPTPDGLLARIERFSAAGYRRIKLKVKPGWDLDILAAVRRRWPGLPLTVDANAAYTAADFTRLKEFDRFHLNYIEQPLPHEDLVDHARLQKLLTTDICLDESVTGPDACRSALALKSGRIVNIKLGRVGGHTAARQVHDLCMGAGVPVWCGGMLETGIGRAHNVALATLPNFLLPGDISASDRYYAEDLVDPPFTLEPDGSLGVPSGPGLGVRVVEERIEKAARHQWDFAR